MLQYNVDIYTGNVTLVAANTGEVTSFFVPFTLPTNDDDDVVIYPFQGDNESEIVWSNPVDKNMTTTIEVNVEANTDDSLAGTLVKFVNVNELSNSYEIVLADSIARFKRLQGYEVFMQTGTDEHGQKIEEKAAAKGVTPKAFVDEIAGEIKSIWDQVGTSYDKFIRTTDADHVAQVAKIFKKFAKSRRGGLQFYSTRLNFSFRSGRETSEAERFGFCVFRRGFERNLTMICIYRQFYWRSWRRSK